MSWHYYTRSCPVYRVCYSSTTHVVSKPGLVPREQQERNTARYRTEHSKRYGHWGLNFHLIGLSFKYLTQDNYHRKKRPPFLVLKVFRKIRETAIKFQCSHQGCEIRLVMEQKKVPTQKCLAGRSPNFRIQTLDRGGSCQSPACDSLVLWEKSKVR